MKRFPKGFGQSLWFYRLIGTFALALPICLSPVSAMEIKLVGTQMILSGPLIPGDAKKVGKVIEENPNITEVICRNSPGGDVPTGYAIGNLMREKGLRTAVSGYCFSGCSRIFLGGKERVFTDDYPIRFTHVGFHGHYYTQGQQTGQLHASLVAQWGLKKWIINHSDGKADPELVERWINIPVAVGMIHFFHPQIARELKAATFFCEHGPARGAGVFKCEPIAKNAFNLGVLTSLEMIRSNDQSELRAAMSPIPPATNFARIDEIDKVPISSPKGLAEYQRFLQSDPPRAFAIAPDRAAWAWNAGGLGAAKQALSRCAERAGKPCLLYAVDYEVVWQSSP
jgi:hypothetical protein